MTKQERNKNLIKFLAPTVLSQVSVFLFTIVDGVFVGRGVGSNALGAINVAFPFIMIFSSLVMVATIGGLTIGAIRMGRQDIEGANQVFMHSFVISAAISAVMMLLGLLFARQIAYICGARGDIIELSRNYIFWYSVFFIPCGLCNNVLGFCRVDNDPNIVTISVIIGTSLNVVGDYLLMYPLGMGIKGAAIATGAAQTINLLVGLIHFFKKKGVLRFGKFTFSGDLGKKMIARGIPDGISKIATPIEVALTNNVLSTMLSEAAVGAYSVLCYAASFSIAIFAGVAEGLQPLIGNSYGAGSEKDLKAYFRSGLIIATTGSTVISVLIYLLGGSICDLYAVSDAVRVQFMEALPWFVGGFIFQAPVVIMASYLYSTTRSKQATFINAAIAFVVVPIVVLAGPRLFGGDFIWKAFVVYEIVALIMSIIIVKRADRNGVIGYAAE